MKGEKVQGKDRREDLRKRKSEKRIQTDKKKPSQQTNDEAKRDKPGSSLSCKEFQVRKKFSWNAIKKEKRVWFVEN